MFLKKGLSKYYSPCVILISRSSTRPILRPQLISSRVIREAEVLTSPKCNFTWTGTPVINLLFTDDSRFHLGKNFAYYSQSLRS